jgi:hypothetical protein
MLFALGHLEEMINRLPGRKPTAPTGKDPWF